MRIVSETPIHRFIRKHLDAEKALKTWLHAVKQEQWDTPQMLADRYPKARILKGNRVIFNIRRNRYRIVALIYYRRHVVDIRFVGTHAEYDRINAEEI